MKHRVLVPAAILAMFLTACSATGPVRFYQGPPKPADQLGIVIVPAAINVRSIDGRAVDSPSKESGTYQLELLPGRHLIAFSYALFWGNSYSGRMIKSKEVGVDAVFNAGTVYRLTYKVPHSKDEAQDLAFHFSATLVNGQTGQSYASYGIENLTTALAAKGITGGQAPTAENNTTAHADTTSMTSQADKAVNQDPVKRLKFWWLMANPQQRKQFSDWMKTATESFAPTQNKNKPEENAPPDTINGVKLKP